MSSRIGKVVLNHSTHVEGLTSVLHRLASRFPDLTLIPGRIATSRGRHEGFDLKITTPTPQGFKLVARRGKTAQEVFVVTTLNRDELNHAIKEEIK
mmetsp:Transcript_5332/g.10867  ORF Transcript_5332/g.10867 Transcript_5332/m.10867 type:complete len:96 (+) Transcript_5332:106-393(+)